MYLYFDDCFNGNILIWLYRKSCTGLFARDGSQKRQRVGIRYILSEFADKNPFVPVLFKILRLHLYEVGSVVRIIAVPILGRCHVRLCRHYLVIIESGLFQIIASVEGTLISGRSEIPSENSLSRLLNIDISSSSPFYAPLKRMVTSSTRSTAQTADPPSSGSSTTTFKGHCIFQFFDKRSVVFRVLSNGSRCCLIPADADTSRLVLSTQVRSRSLAFALSITSILRALVPDILPTEKQLLLLAHLRLQFRGVR